MTDFFLKPLLHMKAIARNGAQQLVDILVCVLGVVAMVYATTLTIKSWAIGSGGEELGYCGPIRHSHV